MKSLNRITKALEYAGFTIVYDKEYEQYAYVCVEEISNQEVDNMKHVKVTNCESGDWQILEINGVEWASGHSITEHDWLGLLSEHFDAQIECDCISDEEMELKC